MFNFRKLATIGGVCLSALMAGCGGGGSTPPAASTLSGVAAVGSPIVGGAVKVTCAAGSALTATTSSAGAWQVTVSGQTLPCAVQMAGGTINSAANATPYHSIATALGTVNVTPLTDLMVANLAAGAPDAWFSALTGVTLNNINQTKIDTALTNLRTALGLTPLNTINPITTAFTPTSGNISDDMLAALSAAMTSASVTYADLLANASASTFVAPAGFGAALTAAYANTTSGGSGGGAGSGTTSGAITAPLAAADGHYMLAYSSGPDIGIDFRAASTLQVTMDSATGGLLAYDINPAATINPIERIQIGTNSIAELGGDANITWGRWNGGATTGNYFGSSTLPGTIGATQGFHYVVGTAATLPTTGTVSYTLSGATQPTVGSGGLGTFSGTVKIDYATDKVGIDFTVTMPDHTYHIVSTGGLTTLSTSELTIDRTRLYVTGDTIFGSIPMPVGGSACTTSSCMFMFDGMVVGAQGSNEVGGTYVIGNVGAGSVHGAATFKP
ncbi:MAG: hypothetical protein NUV63_01060 [Gallionella sp.]|nr:hypothetical protein [Gallionella sp.]